MKGNKILLILLNLVTMMCLSFAATTQAQTTALNYNGRASGVIADVNTLEIITANARVGDTTELAPSTAPAGGRLTDIFVGGNALVGLLGINNTLSTGIIPLRTSAGSAGIQDGGNINTSQSQAAVNNLDLLLFGNTFISTAGNENTLTANSACQCTTSGASCSGNSVITNLVVNGDAQADVTASSPPNTIINPLVLNGQTVGTIFINEQTVATEGNKQAITVNALRILIPSQRGDLPLANIIVSQSQSDITCASGATAAAVSVSGRVTDSRYRGIYGATVNLTSQSGEVQTTRTNFLGYYTFKEAAPGETYIFNVYSKRYQFSPQVVTLTENLDELNFTAQ